MPAKKGLYRIPEGMTATPSQAGKKTPSQAGRITPSQAGKKTSFSNKRKPRHSFAASNIHIFSKNRFFSYSMIPSLCILESSLHMVLRSTPR